jgi:eukaryotic-like serine/threonine-protein kinase
VTGLQGRVLAGRYELGRVLGTGGMATVYLAGDRVLQRQVAVKVLNPPYALDPAFVERFAAEARTAARLSHPNVVAVFDSGADAGVHYLVMEYVPGESLVALLRRQGPLPPRRAAGLAAQVCAALAAAHAQGVIHRDVKPGNVLLAGDGRVRVADFGIAKAATDHAGTGDGMVLGTAAYLPPEQAQGGPADARSDLYALGCVLYELLTGAPPFGSKTDSLPMAILERQVRQPPEPPSARNPLVDHGLDAVVLTALAKRPEQRYQSAQALRDDLERLLSGPALADGPAAAEAATEPLPALPTGGARAARAAARRPGRVRWALLALAGVVIAALVAVLWPDSRGTPAGRGQAAATTAPSPTSPPTTAPPTSSTRAASQADVQGALANVTVVLAAGERQGLVDHHAEEELRHQVEEVAKTVGEEGHQDGKGEEAGKKLVELQRKLDDLVGKGKIRPPATTQILQAIAQLATAVQQTT